MKFYYSAKNPDFRGKFMIHGDDCNDLPDVLERVYLGIFPNATLALTKAQEHLQLDKLGICKCCSE